jgi:hypothetical protein
MSEEWSLSSFIILAAPAGHLHSSSMADQEASGENKPQPKQEGQVINLIVKDQMGAEVHFKVKSHTKLEKVCPAQCTAWQKGPLAGFDVPACTACAFQTQHSDSTGSDSVRLALALARQWPDETASASSAVHVQQVMWCCCVHAGVQGLL